MLTASSSYLKYLLTIGIALTANSWPIWALPSIEPNQNRLLASVPEVEIATITGKDLVHPTLSPDGKFLAYSEVLIQKGAENTAVVVLNLATKEKFTLIDDRTAAKYKTYSAYVSTMTWLKPDRLTVTISDGDVDSTELTFDPQMRKLIASKSNDPGASETIRAQEMKQRAQVAKQILQLFPKIDRTVLDRAIKSEQAFLMHDTVLLQGKLFDREENLWMINLNHKLVKKVFKTGNPLATASLDNVNRIGKSSILFTLTANKATPILFRYDSGRVNQIGKLPGLGNLNRPIKIVYNSPQRTMLIGYVYDTYAQGNNLLYLIEKGQIVKSTKFTKLYDVHVNIAGTRIAYCYWSKGKRQITVKELP
jgi:hypothetical protein